MPSPSVRALLLATLFVPPPAGAAAPSVFGGKIACAEQDGVQFCQGAFGSRIESFDGVPLDVNVTLPPADQTGPFPLIVELHGYGGSKSNSPSTERALAGYVVVNYSARGFGESCGSIASRAPDMTLANPDVCVERGWVRLADARYEVRDTQHLAGLLADEGLVIPDKIGVTGASYGGGQSLILAALRNRVMLPDGTYAPWQSPMGLDMEIAAAAPLIPWSDLSEALTPAGRTLDYRTLNPYGPRAGIVKSSWVTALYLGGLLAGYYAPIGMDPEADLPRWNQFLGAGEPYDGTPLGQAIFQEIAAHHGAYGIDDSIPPAPLFIYNAWTDDLFPADEAIRYERKAHAKYPDAEIALYFADLFGHPRAGLGNGLGAVPDRIAQHFARHLLGEGDPLAPVETYTQACNGAMVEGPFVAESWDAVHPGEVRFHSREEHRFDQRGGDAEATGALDPLVGPPCRTVEAFDDANTATYRLPAPTDAGYTLLGSPTVVADLSVAGSFAQVVARLWDVAPDGMQTLVSHSLYRPRSDNRNPQVFQLHPNGWRFATGHVPKLELLGQSPPFGLEATGEFSVTVGKLQLRLPVQERPDGRAIFARAARVLPPAAEEPPDTGLPGCPDAPADGCVASADGSLKLEDGSAPARDLLIWKWKGAAADFGDPTATSAFHLCVYDGADALVASVAAPSGGVCGEGRKAKACWSQRGRGFAYASPGGSDEGLRALALKQKGDRATIALRAQGPGLAPPALPLALPARVQLLASGGACFEASFSAPARRNAAGEFFDSAD